MAYLFTSESVSEGHPDKVADQISDALLDQFLAYDEHAHCAIESFCTTGQVVIMGEVRSTEYVDLQTIARKTIKNIGYTKSEYQFDGDSCGVLTAIHEQSDDINRGVSREEELAFEGMRFNDLQRWLLLTEAPYNTKYEQVFERVSSDPKHPENGQVSGYGKKVIIKRDFTAKHYWFPFPTDQTQLYAEFPQNPGW